MRAAREYLGPSALPEGDAHLIVEIDGREAAVASERKELTELLDRLDALGIERAHVVGYSMGGGVALEMCERSPERIASLTLLSAIGVQERASRFEIE